jgi:hypothetical protein
MLFDQFLSTKQCVGKPKRCFGLKAGCFGHQAACFALPAISYFFHFLYNCSLNETAIDISLNSHLAR